MAGTRSRRLPGFLMMLRASHTNIRTVIAAWPEGIPYPGMHPSSGRGTFSARLISLHDISYDTVWLRGTAKALVRTQLGKYRPFDMTSQ